MIRILGFILTIAGAISLVIGVLGIFGNIEPFLNSWALIILGVVFFFAGIAILKNRGNAKESSV